MLRREGVDPERQFCFAVRMIALQERAFGIEFDGEAIFKAPLPYVCQAIGRCVSWSHVKRIQY